MPAYETLQNTKILNVTGLQLSVACLTANFGDGYGAGALVGAASGLRRWVLSADVLPDLEEYQVEYDVGGLALDDTRFQYLWSFYLRHLTQGNRPFFITDPRTGRTFLASFADIAIDFQAFSAKLYSGSLAIVQRRARGLVFLDEDGSYVREEPSTPVLSVFPNSLTDVRLVWTPSVDNNAVIGYEVRLNSSYVVNVGLVTEYPFGSLTAGQTYDFEVRAYDGDTPPKFSNWSNVVAITVTGTVATYYLRESGDRLLENGEPLIET
jgi:hypothetical protein